MSNLKTLVMGTTLLKMMRRADLIDRTFLNIIEPPAPPPPLVIPGDYGYHKPTPQKGVREAARRLRHAARAKRGA